MADPGQLNRGGPPHNKRKRKDLTSDQRKQIISELIDNAEKKDGEYRLKRGALAQVAKIFDTHATTISRIWETAKNNRNDPNVRAFRATPKKKGRCGKWRKWDREEVRQRIKDAPTHLRRSLRKLATATGIPKSTLHNMKEKEDDVIRPHSNAIKPTLTETNKLTRLLYCSEHIIPGEDSWVYDDYYNSVHVDEKWFFLTMDDLLMYLAVGEDPPERHTKSKRFILKVMFLAAVARPRFDNNGNCIFDGKIGLWPFVEEVVAQRTSVNRVAGTIEKKPITVTKEVYLDALVDKVAPAIKAKWPDRRQKDIDVQHDNAPVHFKDDEEAWAAVARAGRWNIRIAEQGPNSPDTNVCDLGFFRALQSSQFDHGFATDIDGLIDQVKRAWDEFPPEKIDDNFLTLQCCLDEILKCGGGNNYKIPHMGKEKLRREGRLPTRIEASDEAVEAFMDYGF